MTNSTRARYTLEFKEEAVRLVTGSERVAPGILACRSRRCITGRRQAQDEVIDWLAFYNWKGCIRPWATQAQWRSRKIGVASKRHWWHKSGAMGGAARGQGQSIL